MNGPFWDRREFVELVVALGLTTTLKTAYASDDLETLLSVGSYRPGRISNEYSLFLTGEERALQTAPVVRFLADGVLVARVAGQSAIMRCGDQLDGWHLVGVFIVKQVATAIFEKHVSHRGALIYVTEHMGVTACIPKQIGQLENVRPRQTDTPHGVKLVRASHFEPGTSDRAGQYILCSVEDPSYENVAALGAEYIGWTLVANEEAGPQGSLYLDAAGRSRQAFVLTRTLGEQHPDSSEESKPWRLWAPDAGYPVFDPIVNPAVEAVAPQICDALHMYAYVDGYSKRTLLGGYMPVANVAVWNPNYGAGYEVIMLLPSGANAKPLARVRHLVPEELATLMRSSSDATDEPNSRSSTEGLSRASRFFEHNGRKYVDSYWNGSADEFYAGLAGVWGRWRSFHERAMQVDIPDEWLLNAAQAGLTLTRCSYKGLEPTYQVGEGAYTKFHASTDCAARSACDEIAFSDAVFPVAHYEFVWAHQLWSHCDDADQYFQYYLDHYVLPSGDFLYNTLSGEAPLNVGVILANSTRSYFYGRSFEAFEKRLPVLDRMIRFVLERYEYSKAHFAAGDRRRGLIWGTPEADLAGDQKQGLDSHPYYFQNAAWIWRGLVEHARGLAQASKDGKRPDFAVASARYREIAREMRGLIEESIATTRVLGNVEMRAAGITPFSPSDTDRKVTELENYENHRFMEDWFLADWGDPQLDLGHLKHRDLSGRKMMGLGLGHGPSNTSNFMAHGTLSVLIRQEDYRAFLLALYALTCYAADSGNRYSPEDAFIPGGHPLEGDPNWWSAVVNSTLQPTLGLRWLLCYEETDSDVCHLQKAAPKHWFAEGRCIAVKKCPTRFGMISWSTCAVGDRQWKITIDLPKGFSADLVLHIHPSDDRPVRSTSAGVLWANKIVLHKELSAPARKLHLIAS